MQTLEEEQEYQSTHINCHLKNSSLRKQPNFATSPLVCPRNDLWGTSAEVPYWWRVTIHFWLTPNQSHYSELGSDTSLLWISVLISQMSFYRKTSCDVAKCRVFPDLATERERHLTTRKRTERTKIDFRRPICRCTIGQASCLICTQSSSDALVLLLN